MAVSTEIKEKSLLITAAGAFFKHLAVVVLPYILGSVAIALVWAYFAFSLNTLSGAQAVVVYSAVFLVCGAFAFVYGTGMAVISTLKSIVIYIEDFASEMFDKVRARMESKVASMDEGIAKQQAELLLKSSIKEVAAVYKQYAPKGALRAGLILILSIVTWLVSKILLGRVKEATGMDITVGILFANKVLIISAIFFNMRLLLSFMQVLGFVFGAIILILPIIFL